MGLRSGSARFNPAVPPMWVRLATDTSGLTARVTLRGNDSRNMLADLVSRAGGGLKGSVHALAVLIEGSVTVPAGGAALRYNSRTQRLSNYIVGVNMPGFASPWLTTSHRLGGVDMLVRNLVNPNVKTFARNLFETELDAGLRNPGATILDIGTQTWRTNGDVYPTANDLDTWQDDDHLVVALDNGAGATSPFADLGFVFACKDTGVFGSDKMPLSMFVNQSQPVEVTVEPNANPVGLLYPALSVHTVTRVSLMAYVSFDRVEQPSRHGLFPCFREITRAGAPYTPDPRPYFFQGFGPNFTSATLDNGLAFLYEPPRYQSVASSMLAARIRLTDDAIDVFPVIKDRDTFREFLDMFNYNATMTGEYTKLRYSTLADFNRFNAGLVANTIPYPPSTDHGAMLGIHSAFPYLPVNATFIRAKGFPLGLYQRSSDTATRLAIELNGYTPPTNTMVDLFVNDMDDSLIERYCAEDAMRSLSFAPDLDNPAAPMAQAVSVFATKVAQ